MKDRLRAKRGLSYPADAESLRLVREAGGFSKLSKEARARVRVKHVNPGGDCSDMPEESVPLRLARGEVERVAVQTPAAGHVTAPRSGRREERNGR